MNSLRLPGKMLKTISGQPLLWYLLESLSRSQQCSNLIVGTSHEMTDYPLVRYCEKISQAVFTGSLKNVAKRFLRIIDELDIEAFVRICGDSPLIDYRVVDQAIDLYMTGGYDLVTNIMPRSFPKGESVEVIRASAFRAACSEMASEEEREHVTLYFYNNVDKFSIKNFSADQDYSDYNFCVDTKEDLERISRMIGKVGKPHTECSWKEWVKLDLQRRR